MSDEDLVQGIKALVVEATRDTPRMTAEQVAARAAAQRREAMAAIYRRSPGLYEAVTAITRRVRQKQERRSLHRRVFLLLFILLLCFVFAAIEDAFT